MVIIMDEIQVVTLSCYSCKRPLAQVYMSPLDDLCCLSIRCCKCQLKNVDWKLSQKTNDRERAEIWAKIVRMNDKDAKG